MFLAAAGISLLAFVLTWLLREVPLREKTRFEAAGDAIPPPSAPTEPVGAPRASSSSPSRGGTDSSGTFAWKCT